MLRFARSIGSIDHRAMEDSVLATTDIQGFSERIARLGEKVDALRRFL